MSINPLHTISLPTVCDLLAPDGSEIRELCRLPGASMAHGFLPSDRTSVAIRHRTVEEIWFVLSGSAEIWRRIEDMAAIDTVTAGQS